MVLDKIENSKIYANLNERIAKAFAFINSTDLLQIAPGRYEIDNSDIYALVQEYDTKDISEGKLEGHLKYIDIQYVIAGAELMGVTSLKNQFPIEKNDEKDYTFYKGDPTFIRVDTGMFTIFFPDDLHMPCIKINQSEKVKKLVIKIKV